MRLLKVFLFAILFAVVGSVANAQTYYFYPNQQYGYAYMYYPTYLYQPTVTTPVDVVVDVVWFTNELNRIRSSYGLPPVAYDVGLDDDSQMNNQFQNQQGLGHYYMGDARRQNAAWNADTYSALGMWMNSPGHRDALLDGSIRWFSLTRLGQYMTFSAY